MDKPIDFEQGRPAQPRLTSRETQIARLIALGQTSGQIALELGVSHRTVDAHAEHIRKKLNVRSRVQIAAWAVGQGLLREK